MSATANKATIKAIYDALATGNAAPLVAAMHDDFSWRISGQGPWARTWRGKSAVLGELLGPLTQQFAGTYRGTARRILADEDFVVVEYKGNVETRAGERYDNDYCLVYQLAADGKLLAVTEYMDTALAERVLISPPAVRANPD
jgi:ketosteroid isomerase-like protein